MPTATKEGIFGATGAALPRVKVPTPEWGDENTYVYIRCLTGEEWDHLVRTAPRSADGEPHVGMVAVVAAVVVDENGKQLFTAPQDRIQLGGTHAAVINRIYLAAQDHSGLTEDALERLEGNLPETNESSAG